jgi:uncharacterized protein (DUF1800 family)
MAPRVVSRRAVLGAAAAGGGAVASLRLLGAGTDLVRSRGASGDWSSPLADEKARVAHLLRRATFGANPGELEKAASEGFDRTVERLLETPPSPPPALPAPSRIAQLQLWWAAHMLQSPTPFAERMTLFWHGHFTSDYRKVSLRTPYLYWQNLSWREMALGDLRSMLMRVTTDPAMLRYLDLATSTGANPNENYARELMELFSLGVGKFTEDDVRAAAKALAGWVEPRGGARSPGRFVPARAYQGGRLTFLARTGDFDAEKVVEQILAQPAAAVFIAGKVVEQFVSPRPDESYVRRLADRFRSGGYQVKSLMRDVFTSPEFTGAGSYRALVKTPVEMMVSALKALKAPSLVRLLPQFGPSLGQALFDPPDVGGWPNNEAWISSQNVVARVNFVTAAVQQAPALPPAREALAHLDGVLSKQTSQVIDAARDDRTRWLAALASPEFQLK